MQHPGSTNFLHLHRRCYNCNVYLSSKSFLLCPESSKLERSHTLFRNNFSRYSSFNQSNCFLKKLNKLQQISFFCALLSLATEWEAAELHCVLLQQTVPDTFIESASLKCRLFWMGSKADSDPKNLERNLKDGSGKSFFKEWLARLILMLMQINLISIFSKF